MSRGGHDALRYSHLGIQFALIIGLLFYGGTWLDERYGTQPLFTFLGLLFGFGAAMYHLVREATKIDEESKQDRDGGQA